MGVILEKLIVAQAVKKFPALSKILSFMLCPQEPTIVSYSEPSFPYSCFKTNVKPRWEQSDVCIS